MNKKLIVDSDAIYALYNPNDLLHKKVIQTFEDLITYNIQLIYPTSVLFEIISLFQRVLPTPRITKKFTQLIRDNAITIAEINTEILQEAAVIFNPEGTKKNTLIDCSVVALAKALQADGVFSYDEFYRKQKLASAEDVLRSIK